MCWLRGISLWGYLFHLNRTNFNAEHKKVNQPINQCPKQPFERLKKKEKKTHTIKIMALSVQSKRMGYFYSELHKFVDEQMYTVFLFKKIDSFRHLPLS